MTFIPDKEYKRMQNPQEDPGDPFRYMRQRNTAWKSAGSTFSSLLSGWILSRIIILLLVGSFLFIVGVHILSCMF